MTALFCDIVGSTSLAEEFDPEALQNIFSRYFDDVARIIERHGGTVQKFAGDAVLAVFGVPRVHEDDAVRAVRAAAEIRTALPTIAERVGVPLRLRMGINTGLVMSDEGKSTAIGDVLNVAARLEQAAEPDEILLGAETQRMVRSAVEVEAVEQLTLKGKSQPVAAYRLLSVDPIRPGVARRQDDLLIGREPELSALAAVWQRAVAARNCQTCTVVGSAGVGKSRLVAELLVGVADDAVILSGRCLPYGEGITFWPLVEALTAVGEPARKVLDHLSRGGAGSPEELFFQVRQLLESLATQRPVILHLDDLQWAEQMLLDLLEHIGDLSSGAPILLLCTARTELLEDRPNWRSGKLNSTTVLLHPLTETDCGLLLDRLDDQLGPELRNKVISASEGNPLFLQEMAALAREQGSVAVPPTIQAVLAARLEQLRPGERTVLELGAVEGQIFHRSALAAMGCPLTSAEVETELQRLVRKDLIRGSAADVHGEQAFRFRHLLIRDAAYERLPKAARAHLHEAYARWLESKAGDVVEVDEIIGWHLEQAVRHRRDLRHEVGVELTLAGASHLHAAGRRATKRNDVIAACNLMGRALTLAANHDRLRGDIEVDLAERLVEIGDIERADQLLTSLERNPERHATVALTRLEWLAWSNPGAATETVDVALPGLLEDLARRDDERGQAKAHWVASSVRWMASQASPMAHHAKLAAEHARRAGDDGLYEQALGRYVAALVYGPQHTDVLAEALDSIEAAETGPYLAGILTFGRAELARHQGDFELAREMLDRTVGTFSTLGMRPLAGSMPQVLARIEFAAGDLRAARAALLRSDAMLAELDERPYRSTTQALLARAQEALGDLEGAEAAAELAEELGGAEDVSNFAITHEVRGRLALARGDDEAAKKWARSAVQSALQTDFVDYQAEAMLGLAHILSACGETEVARREAVSALDLFLAKGNRLGADAARLVLDRLPST